MDHISIDNVALYSDGHLLCALRNGTRSRRESGEDVPSLEGEGR